MKCENCGNELAGSAIVCLECNHNNARQRVSNWRARQASTQQYPSHGNSQIDPLQKTLPLKVEPKPVDDPNLVRFPADPVRKQSQMSPLDIEPELGEYPPWRAQLKEKVRLAREKRLAQTPTSHIQRDEADLDPNPLVEAALRRIRKPSQTIATSPALTTTGSVIRKSAPTTVVTETLELDPNPKPTGYRPITKQPQRPPITTTERATRPLDPIKTVVHKIDAKIEVKKESKPETKTEIKTETKAEIKTEIKTETKTETKTLKPKPIYDIKLKPEIKSPATGGSGATAKVLEPLIKEQTKPSQPEKSERDPVLVFALPSSIGKDGSVETEIVEIPLAVSNLPELFPGSASLWTRTLAGACDFEIISMAFLPIFAAYATLNTSLGNEAFFILTVLLAATTFLYQAVTLLLADRTFGMALLNMRLINTEDESLPITRRQKLLRAWAASIAFLCPPLNLIVMQLNTLHLSLPDLISGTSPTEK